MGWLDAGVKLGPMIKWVQFEQAWDSSGPLTVPLYVKLKPREVRPHVFRWG